MSQVTGGRARPAWRYTVGEGDCEWLGHQCLLKSRAVKAGVSGEWAEMWVLVSLFSGESAGGRVSRLSYPGLSAL